jgi:NADPH2:quinone reductase
MRPQFYPRDSRCSSRGLGEGAFSICWPTYTGGMKAIIFDRFGDPGEVLHVGEVPVPQPGPGQVRVRMLASPINPSDLMVVRGQYGRLPALPGTPGFEGVGVVDAVGSGFLRILRGLKPGRRVAVLNSQGGNWAEFVVLPARQVVPVTDDLPEEQVATFFVNPATTLVMTRWVLQVRPGDWLLQTAAGSALGRMIIRLGKHDGFRTINLVRRREQVAEIKQLGGDEVICTSDENVQERVRALTQGQGVRYALDAVGSSTGLAVIRALAHEGRMLVYGTLANEPMQLDPRLLMVGKKRVEGFWLSEWVKKQGILTMLKLFRNITQLLRQNVLTTQVEATLAPEEIRTAVAKAETPGHGKILLRLGSRS